MRCLIILSILLNSSITSYCQLNDNFSDGNLDVNPTWIDTAEHFIVNDENVLQLMAPSAGESLIYSNIELADSIRWSSYCKMDFAPSGSNLLRIYLAADSTIVEEGNSLYFQIGETGSEDAIHLYQNNFGLIELIASASMGAVGFEPAEFTFILEKDIDNIWSFYVDYNQTGFQLEWEMNMNIDWLHTAKFFGFYTKYTSSRTDKFFFDDIVVEPLLPDVEKPLLLSADLVSPSQIDVRFSEPMDPSTLENLNNYTIEPNLNTPTSVNVNTENTSLVSLFYTSNPLQSGIDYTLIVKNLLDLAGNEIDRSEIVLQLVEPALPGDIYVNEILFNPSTGGFDFVEIYNASNKLIDLSTLIIANVQKDIYENVETSGVFYPGQYLAFCQNIEWLENNYNVIYPNQVLENKMPSFNDDDGNVSIFSRQRTGVRIMTDSLDYDEDWHFVLLDDEEGVSLEKISPNLTTNDRNNWHSAAENAGFGTPGYANSQFTENINHTANFTLQEKVFSPNQDGDKDQLLINYSLDKPGYLATVKVYNDRGYFIKTLNNNSLLSQNGILTWDGTKNNQQVASIGIYILVYELFHPDGDILSGKLSCVLADFLD